MAELRSTKSPDERRVQRVIVDTWLDLNNRVDEPHRKRRHEQIVAMLTSGATALAVSVAFMPTTPSFWLSKTFVVSSWLFLVAALVCLLASMRFAFYSSRIPQTLLDLRAEIEEAVTAVLNGRENTPHGFMSKIEQKVSEKHDPLERRADLFLLWAYWLLGASFALLGAYGVARIFH